MTFSRETPLSELLKYNKISKRVYNVLTFRRIHTLGHLMEMFDRKSYSTNTFGKRVASEIREL